MLADLRWYRHYLRARLIGRARAWLNRPRQTDELLFVVLASARGWILDGICKDLLRHYPAPARICYLEEGQRLPPASAYFFIHYFIAMVALAHDPNVWRARRLVWYTHPSDELIPAPESEIRYALNSMNRVICTNRRDEGQLIARGVSAQRVTTLLGAADPDLFQSGPRPGTGGVCLSSAYYPRKNPELIAAVVRAMPDLRFVLLGKDWEHWDGFAALRACPNFEYLTLPYRDYPAQYRRLDCYLSASRLEGGPIPLIETMMCNLVPVVSDTGFARDLVRHGENGYLFPVDARPEQVAALIRQALGNRSDVAATVAHLSWQAMAQGLHRHVTECRP
ncbi:MAG TPA: glycosyltransferase family 4 protein [Lamprocystis sp. (in: g-proteobacteria)]|nr:glycosyltransferase family 4 protein [Lamprocystis sp. (in: g-proteobacteria)]